MNGSVLILSILWISAVLLLLSSLLSKNRKVGWRGGHHARRKFRCECWNAHSGGFLLDWRSFRVPGH
jgi:hypothetical protein